MKTYLVTAEREVIHKATVKAENEDGAVKAYLAYDWDSDRGEESPESELAVLSVEEVVE
jgi:hypothetical protein